MLTRQSTHGWQMSTVEETAAAAVYLPESCDSKLQAKQIPANFRGSRPGPQRIP